MEIKRQSSVNVHARGQVTTTLPAEIVRQMELEHKSRIEYIVTNNNGDVKVEIRKLAEDVQDVDQSSE